MNRRKIPVENKEPRVEPAENKNLSFINQALKGFTFIV